MLLLFFIGQLLVAFYAWFSGKADVSWSWPFRNLGEEVFSKALKDQWSKRAHREGYRDRWAALLGVSLFIFTNGNGLSFMILVWYLLYFILLGVWFWLVFDISFARGINKDWWFTGTSSLWDQRVGNRGKQKAYLCAGAVLILNIVFLIFFI